MVGKKNKESQKTPFIFKCLSATVSKDIFHYLFYNVSFEDVDGVRFGRQRATQVRGQGHGWGSQCRESSEKGVPLLALKIRQGL